MLTPTKHSRKSTEKGRSLMNKAAEEDLKQPTKLSPSIFGLQRIDSVSPQPEQTQRKRKSTILTNGQKLSPISPMVPVSAMDLPACDVAGCSKKPTIEEYKDTATRILSGEMIQRRVAVQPKVLPADDNNERLKTIPKSCSLESKTAAPPATDAGTQTVLQITPTHEVVTAAQRVHHLLKVAKVRKWMFFEWFYSSIDASLLNGDNDFQVCLVELFPLLRTRQLTRGEWQMIRRRLGKPRRCSPAFFEEERRSLERKRQKIRRIQSGNVNDGDVVRDLPEIIPMSLSVGTRVIAHLRSPHNGVFCGTIDAFDPTMFTYRVTFERDDLGTHTISDIDITAENKNEIIPVQKSITECHPNLTNQLNSGGSYLIVPDTIDPETGLRVQTPWFDGENLNGYPLKMLEAIIRLRRALDHKRSNLQRLTKMNDEAERLIASQNAVNGTRENFQPFIAVEFKQHYAMLLLSMEIANSDFLEKTKATKAFTSELMRMAKMEETSTSFNMLHKCRETAELTVERYNQGKLKDKRVISLITNLTTLMQIAQQRPNNSNLVALNQVLMICFADIKESLFGENFDAFESVLEKLGLIIKHTPPPLANYDLLH